MQRIHRGLARALHRASAVPVALLLLNCREGPVEPETPISPIPAEIASTWTTGNVSSVNFYNPATGQFGPPTGTGLLYTFHLDGHYEKGVLLQSSLYGCSMTVFFYESGTSTTTASTDGTWTIELYPTYGRNKSQDTCVAANNYQRAHELGRETLIAGLGRDDFGNEALFMRYPDTGFLAFYRQQ